MAIDYKSLRDRLAEYDADPESILLHLVDLRQRCRDGVLQEKNSARGDAVEVLEKYPQVELAITKEIRNIAEYITAQADRQESDRELVVTFEDAMVPTELEDLETAEAG